MYQLRSGPGSASASILCRNDDHILELMHVQVQHGTCIPDTKSCALDDFPKNQEMDNEAIWQTVGFSILSDTSFRI